VQQIPEEIIGEAEVPPIARSPAINLGHDGWFRGLGRQARRKRLAQEAAADSSERMEQRRR